MIGIRLSALLRPFDPGHIVTPVSLGRSAVRVVGNGDDSAHSPDTGNCRGERLIDGEYCETPEGADRLSLDGRQASSTKWKTRWSAGA